MIKEWHKNYERVLPDIWAWRMTGHAFRRNPTDEPMDCPAQWLINGQCPLPSQKFRLTEFQSGFLLWGFEENKLWSGFHCKKTPGFSQTWFIKFRLIRYNPIANCLLTWWLMLRSVLRLPVSFGTILPTHTNTIIGIDGERHMKARLVIFFFFFIRISYCMKSV